MKDNPVLNFLAERRSVLARNMSGPGPDRATLVIKAGFRFG